MTTNQISENVRKLLRDLTDPDPCHFDHHGGCQAHGFLEPEPGEECPHAKAKRLLAEPEEVDGLAELACAWSDYRADYGIPDNIDTTTAHRLFKAGWEARRDGDTRGPIR